VNAPVTGFAVDASLLDKAASKPGVTAWPGTEPGGYPITGQVVPGAEVARAWTAAFVRNVGWRFPIRPPWKGRREGEFQASESRGIEYRCGARRRSSP